MKSVTTTILMLTLLVFVMTMPAQAQWVVGVNDDFNTGITNAANDQNLNYIGRQTGDDAPNPWDDLKNNTQGGVAAWDGRVGITDQASGYQLKVFTGIGETGLWNPGQVDLPASSRFRVSWDQSASAGWGFARLNSNAAGASMECGLLVQSNDWVQLWENGSIVYNPGPTTPTGANGMHHIEVEVIDGYATINVDDGGWEVSNRDWSNLGNNAVDIGTWSVYGQGSGSTILIDNFQYEYIPDPVTWLTVLTDDFDTGISSATNDQNLNYQTRQSGMNSTDPNDYANAWDDLNNNTQGGVAAWDGRVSVSDESSDHYLHISTGIGEQGLWNPGQMDLPQCSAYRLAFDVKNGLAQAGWAFVRFNSWQQGNNLECGLLISGNNVQLFKNGAIVYNPGVTTPSGPNGFHHIEIESIDGIAHINVDNGGWATTVDVTNVGSGKTGVGFFSIFGQQGSDIALDNFEYQIHQVTDIVQSADMTIVSEDGDTDTFTVALPYAPRTDVTIDISDTASTAQVTVSPTQLVFTPGNWDQPQQVTVTAVDDPFEEQNQYTTLALAASSYEANYNGFTSYLSVDITDNDNYWVKLLDDDFTTGISDSTIDQNMNYQARQIGAAAPNAWDDLNYDTQGGVASWDGRVGITDQASGNKLYVFTGYGQQGLWNPGQDDLLQSSKYRLTFDIANLQGDPGMTGWAFVRLNSLQTGNSSMECGFLISGNTVQLWENGSMVYNPGATAPAGANGLHHIEVEVLDGIAHINVDYGAWTVTRDWSSVGTSDTGIGYFSVYGQENSYLALDNLKYSVYQNISVRPTDGSNSVSENGDTDTVGIAIGVDPVQGDVTISFSDDASPAQLQIVPNSLVFDTNNWQDMQTITVSAIDDSLAEIDPHQAQISVTVTSSDPNYAGATIYPITVSIEENDCGAWGYYPADLNQDCTVSETDLTMLASTWLDSLTVPTVQTGSGNQIDYMFTGLEEIVRFYDSLDSASPWLTASRGPTADSTIAGGDWFAIDGPWAKAVRTLPAAVDLSQGDVVIYNTMRTFAPTASENNNTIQVIFGAGDRNFLYDPPVTPDDYIGDSELEPYGQHGYAMYRVNNAPTVIYGNDGSYQDPGYLSTSGNGAVLDAIPTDVWPDASTYVQLALRIHYEPGGSNLPAGCIGRVTMSAYYLDQVTDPANPQVVCLGSADQSDNAVSWVVNSTVINEIGLVTAAQGANFASELSTVGSVAVTQLLRQQPLQGDINTDAYVDFNDFAIMAAEWLNCSTPNTNDCVKP